MSADAEPLPELAAWDLYEFPEVSLPSGQPRMSVRDALPPVSMGDLPTFESIDPSGRHTADALLELLSGANPEAADLPYHGSSTHKDPVRWLTVSPFDLYLERVFAEKLGEIE